MSSASGFLETPRCYMMEELPIASAERAKVVQLLQTQSDPEITSLLSIHLAHGLAYTVGSALGSTPPSNETCLVAFLVPNKAGLTAGARAWSKHSHRSQPLDTPESVPDRRAREASTGWWGTPSGPVAVINERALALFWKVMGAATWRNLHWLPHQILVYEVRVAEGYGMRWAQDQSERDGVEVPEDCPWAFRGFVEPMMENGHELGWRH